MSYIFITGVSSGIGLHATQFLIEKGYTIFGSVRKKEDAMHLSEQLGDAFIPILMDVTKEDSIQQAFEFIKNKLEGKSLDALINNAGIAAFGPILHLPMEKVRQQFDVNVIGLIQVTQTFLPLLGASKNFEGQAGRIINISSVSGRISSPFLAVYSASKFAVEALSDGLRRELSIYNIPSISIQPGPIKTNIWNKTRGQEEPYLDTDYGDILKDMNDELGKIEGGALAPERVSQTIYKALTSSRPKAHYMVVKNAGFMRLVANLAPATFLDKVTTKRFKK